MFVASQGEILCKYETVTHLRLSVLSAAVDTLELPWNGQASKAGGKDPGKDPKLWLYGIPAGRLCCCMKEGGWWLWLGWPWVDPNLE